ncbi:MAG: hypothetical protein ABIH59_03040 [archaeon]
METNQTELKKLSKQKLIGIIEKYQERLAIMEECGNILRIDARQI